MSILNKLTFKNIAITAGVVAVIGGVAYYLLNSDDTDSIAELATAIAEDAAETATELATEAAELATK